MHVPGPMPLSPTPVGPAQRTSGHTGEASRVEVPASASKCNSAPRTGSRAACEVPSPSGVLEFSAVSPPSASGVRPFAGSDEQALLRDRSFGAQLKQRHDAEQQPLVALPVGAALPPLKVRAHRFATSATRTRHSSAQHRPTALLWVPAHRVWRAHATCRRSRHGRRARCSARSGRVPTSCRGASSSRQLPTRSATARVAPTASSPVRPRRPSGGHRTGSRCSGAVRTSQASGCSRRKRSARAFTPSRRSTTTLTCRPRAWYARAGSPGARADSCTHEVRPQPSLALPLAVTFSLQVLRAAREAVEDDDLVVREFLSPGASSDSPRR